MTEKQREVYDLAVLLRKIEQAPTLNDLILYGEEAKTAPESDKPVLREMYAARLESLKAKLKPLSGGIA